MKKPIGLILSFAFILGVLGACATEPKDSRPLQTVTSIDLQRYLGNWYEIAKYPNWFQRKCISNTEAEYRLNADSTVTVLNKCKRLDGEFEKAEGIAYQIGHADSPKLEVRFAPAWLSIFPFVWGDYWIIDLDKDYSLVAVSEPHREYLWILSRTPTVKDESYQALIKRLEAVGFDTAKLVKTSQPVSFLK